MDGIVSTKLGAKLIQRFTCCEEKNAMGKLPDFRKHNPSSHSVPFIFYEFAMHLTVCRIIITEFKNEDVHQFFFVQDVSRDSKAVD